MHDSSEPKLDSGPAAPPSSVAALATTGEWTVASASKGRWTTVERTINALDSQWVIGLTPVASVTIAAILWRDQLVVDHTRGEEADMCRTASQ